MLNTEAQSLRRDLRTAAAGAEGKIFSRKFMPVPSWGWAEVNNKRMGEKILLLGGKILKDILFINSTIINTLDNLLVAL